MQRIINSKELTSPNYFELRPSDHQSLMASQIQDTTMNNHSRVISLVHTSAAISQSSINSKPSNRKFINLSFHHKKRNTNADLIIEENQRYPMDYAVITENLEGTLLKKPPLHDKVQFTSTINSQQPESYSEISAQSNLKDQPILNQTDEIESPLVTQIYDGQSNSRRDGYDRRHPPIIDTSLVTLFENKLIQTP